MKVARILFKSLILLLALYGLVSLGLFARRLIRSQQVPQAQEIVGAVEVLPVVVIGSGPAGLAAAKTILDEDVPVVILEGTQSGGALNILTPVLNWPGITSITSGFLIMGDMRADVEGYDKAQFVARSVESIDFSGPTRVLHLDNGEVVQAKAVIVAAGTHKRALTVPGSSEYAHSISYDQKPTGFFKKGNCVVVGGGVDALRKAIFRINAGCNVTLVVRADTLGDGIVVNGYTFYKGKERAQFLQELLDAGKLTIFFNTQVVELYGQEGKLTNVRLSNGVIIPADHIAVGMGRSPNTSIFDGQLDLDTDGYIVLKNHSQMTNRSGVFAAGDITGALYAEGAIAAGDGMKAAKDALRYIRNK